MKRGVVYMLLISFSLLLQLVAIATDNYETDDAWMDTLAEDIDEIMETDEPEGEGEGEVSADKARAISWRNKIEEKEELIAEHLEIGPVSGEYHEATVPDTLDLAERGALALNQITGLLKYDAGYELYPAVHFGTDPVKLSMGLSYGGYINHPKLIEALPLMRVMSGSKQNLDIEYKMMLRVLAMIWDDGLLYVPPVAERPWIEPEYEDRAHMPLIPRLMLGLLYYYQRDGNPLWLEQAEKIYETSRSDIFVIDGEHAYIPLRGPETYPRLNYPRGGYPEDMREPGQYKHPHIFLLGNFLRGITRYAEIAKDPEALEFAGKICNTMRIVSPWSWEHQDMIVPPGIVGIERGRFIGHFHGTIAGLRGMLAYARAANDEELKQWLRHSYEYCRCFGIPEIGYYPEIIGDTNGETCSVADLTSFAVELTQAGLGDYWDDIDRYVRNNLAESQFIDKELIGTLSEAGGQAKLGPGDSFDRALERGLGSFSLVTFPTSAAPVGFNCCNHNGALALYHVWKGMLQHRGDGVVQVNLLLNRSSQWLDIDSYLPCEGKVVLHNKSARRIYLRLPSWVSKPDVSWNVASEPGEVYWLRNFLVFDEVQSDSQITVRFPVLKQKIQRTDGGTKVSYTIHLRGNTVVDIWPREGDPDVKIDDGKLKVSGPATLTVNTGEVKDYGVSVNAHSDVDAGIVLRHVASTPDRPAVVAYYNAEEQILRFDEWNHNAPPLPLQDEVRVPGLGPDIHLQARVEGGKIDFSVSDGTNRYSMSYQMRHNHPAGRVGLYSRDDGRNDEGARIYQYYDDFEVKTLQEETIYEDNFSGEKLNGRWSGTEYQRKPLYLRDHMKKASAPMVGKERFFPREEIQW